VDSRLCAFQLDNGLKVLLKEVHTAPVTSTWMWYRVGSRNETEGQTGLSHWVEHMLFKGSAQFPKGAIMRLVNRYGGYANAMTSNDFTAYYATLPSEHTELALRIEADRMTSAWFDPQEVTAERSVVIAEREQSENEPRFALFEGVTAAAYQAHPYRHQTIGYKQDLERITRDELYGHYRHFYAPNNAVLVVVGDLDMNETQALILRHLGAIPPGDSVPQAVIAEPPQSSERRVEVRLPGSEPTLRVVYHAPAVHDPDYIPLVVLDAVLSGGKAMFAFGGALARSARLYRALVETELASSVGSNYHPSLDPYLFGLGATVRQGSQPELVERALLAEIGKLQQQPVEAAELAVAIRQTQAQFVYASESVSNQALTLGFLEMVDHHERIDSILDELARVGPQEVLRVARTYLTAESRTVGWFYPSDKGGDRESTPEPPKAWRSAHESVCAYLPRRAASISPETVTRGVLDNGIVVLIRENPASPSVCIQGSIQAGSLHDRVEQLGCAGLTATLLRRGTRRHTFQELNVALDSVGASLGFGSDLENGELGAQSLAADFDLIVDLLAEMLMQPTFPEDELRKARNQRLTQLSMLETDTSYRADCAYLEALYPAEHPYSRPVLGIRETILSLTANDLAAFHAQHYHPRELVLSIVGALDSQRVLDKLATTLGQWLVDAPLCPWQVADAHTPQGVITQQIEIPAKAQADLVLGVMGMRRASTDYYAAMLANLILGRLGMMGRLGESVRDRQGLAYYVSSSLQAGLGPKPWTVVAGVNPKHVARTVESILDEIERMRAEPVLAEELDDSCTYLTGIMALYLETNEGIASSLLHIEQFGLGLDYLARYPEILRSVTQEDIQRVMRQYFQPQRYVLTMAGTFALSSRAGAEPSG
jgi:zinc protease